MAKIKVKVLHFRSWSKAGFVPVNYYALYDTLNSSPPSKRYMIRFADPFHGARDETHSDVVNRGWKTAEEWMVYPRLSYARMVKPMELEDA